MVAILEKSENNSDFHPMVDFIEASPLRTVTESSLRRNLKLKDKEGISSLPDTELFENLTLMGYNISPNQKFTFQKGQFSHQWKYLIHTIMQCISPKSTRFNEFSSNIATALVCLATNRTYNFSKMIFDGLVKNVNNKISKFLMYPRIVPFFDTMLVQQGEGSGTPTEPHHIPSPKAQSPSHTTHTSPTLPSITTTSLPTVTQSDIPIVRQYTRRTRIAQSSVLPTVADKPASPLRDVSQGEACPTDSGFIVDQDRATIDKLKERVKMLEDREGVAATRSGDDAPIKGRSMDEGEAATERISDDSEEMATVLTSMDAATILASGVVDVPTGSGSIPTASTPAEEQVPTGSGSIPTASTPAEEQVPTASDVVPTASPVFGTATVVTPYRRRKGKEVMVESKTPKKQKV
nr:glutamic acid-rich protein-like [Tanacetum cinerariifolium]